MKGKALTKKVVNSLLVILLLFSSSSAELTAADFKQYSKVSGTSGGDGEQQNIAGILTGSTNDGEVKVEGIDRANIRTVTNTANGGSVNQSVYNSVYNSFQTYSLFSEMPVWTRKTDMQTAKYGFGAAEVNGKIYVVGGILEDGSPINEVEEYDPLTDTWTRKADMPTPREDLGVVSCNGKIYAIGGYIFDYKADWGSFTTVEEYDPVTDTWTRKANMPTPRRDFGVAVVNGKIYAIGGYQYGDVINKVEEYDPSTDTWKEKSPIGDFWSGNPRDGGVYYTKKTKLKAAAINGKIYTFGSLVSDRETVLWTVDEYDPVKDSWTYNKSGMPSTDRYGIAAFNKLIYLIGGDNGGEDVGQINIYNPETNRWELSSRLPYNIYNNCAVIAQNQVFSIGGDGDCIKTVLSSAVLDPIGAILAPSSPTWGTPTSTSLTLNWSQNGNSSSTQYYAKLTDPTTGAELANSGWQTNISTWTFKGLQANKQYKGWVKARNGDNIETGWLDCGIQQTKNDTLDINCTSGTTVDAAITVSNVQSLIGKTFTVTYNANELDLVDLCASTVKIDLAAGEITGTNTKVTQYTGGIIVFTVNSAIPSGKAWSGVVNTIRFKAKVSGSSGVKYLMQ